MAHTHAAHVDWNWQLIEVIKCGFGVAEGNSSFIVFFDNFGDGFQVELGVTVTAASHHVQKSCTNNVEADHARVNKLGQLAQMVVRHRQLLRFNLELAGHFDGPQLGQALRANSLFARGLRAFNERLQYLGNCFGMIDAVKHVVRSKFAEHLDICVEHVKEFFLSSQPLPLKKIKTQIAELIHGVRRELPACTLA